MTLRQNQKKRRQGSVLIVTLILGSAIALALGSFVAVTINALKLSQRSFFSNSSLNLAEAGLEEALHALNTNEWTGWTTHSSGSDNKFYAIGPFDLGQGAVGDAAILVYNATSGTPRIIAQGQTSSSSGSAIIKQIEVKLERRSHWATGVVAKEDVVFSGGNVYIDSYSSCDPTYSTGGQYDPAKRNDRGSVASARVRTEIGVDVGNSDVWGYVATGGAEIDVGPNGTVRGEDTPSNVKVDPNRLTKDFRGNFEPEEQPATTGTATTIAGDDFIVGSSNPDAPLRMTVANLVNSSSETLTITGHVELIVLNTVDVKGSIVLEHDPDPSAPVDSSVKMFVEGNVDVGGTGVVNESKIPADFTIYGTNTIPGSQQIKLHGNGTMYAAVFAPNADIELKGGGSKGELWGSVVGSTVKITGNYDVHYDECLAEETDGNPFSVASWRELDESGERVGLY